MVRAIEVGASTSRVEWQRVAFGEMAESVTERVDNPSLAGVERYVGLEHLDPESIKISRWASPDEVTATKLRFKPGDIIFGRRRAYQRKLAVADFEGICSAHALVLRAREEVVSKDFLPLFMQSDTFFERALAISVGSLSPTINWKTLAREEFALPPKPEQQRIAKILRSVEESIECYESVLSNLRSAEFAVLERDFDTDMANDGVKVRDLVDLNLLEPPQDGNHGELHPRSSDFVKEGIPFLTAGSIRAGEVLWETCKQITPEKAARLRIGFARSGDVLITHKGTVGEVARLGQIEHDYVMLSPQVTYYRVLDSERIDRDYLLHALRSPILQKQLTRRSAQSTRNYIGIRAQLDLNIPLPSFDRQISVVVRIKAIARCQETVRSHLLELDRVRRALRRELIESHV